MAFFTLLLLLVVGRCVCDNPRNNKILFITNSESGLGNVFIATSHAVAVNHPEIELHFASFARFEEPISSISRYAQKQAASSRAIMFHTLPGLSLSETFEAQNRTMDNACNSPGVEGYGEFLSHFQYLFVPWTAEEYVILYEHIAALIEEIDPAVLVVDTLLGPAISATRHMQRKHVMLSANSFKDRFALIQSWGAGFWKYPALSSGYTYPVPWSKIAANMWMNVRLILAALRTPDLNTKKAYIRSQGLPEPINMLTAYDPKVPWIVPSLPGIEFPLDIPLGANVTACGPIYRSAGPLEEQDPELAAWVAQAPTILVNLGSFVVYDQALASSMARALRSVLSQHNVQVLWKFNKRPDQPFNDSLYRAPLEPYLKSERVRMTNWINADPASLLESGHIVLSVHHGGANCFHEAVATGVPSLVLPMWADLYDYAVRTEWLGTGIWANKLTAPGLSVAELEGAFLVALGDGEKAKAMRRKAKDLAAVVDMSPGRDGAAQAIVDYMNGVYEGNVGGKLSSIHEEL